MPIRFVDPRAQPGTPIDPYELAIDVAGGSIAIGLLANGFPDSVNFLDQVQASLAEILPAATFLRYDKGNASIPAPEPLLAEIAGSCQAVIAAYGH